MRQDECLNEAEAHDHDEPEAEQDIAHQAEPTGLQGLPGVEARHAEEAEEAHGAGEHMHYGPPGAGHGREDVRRMEHPDKHVTNTRHHSG